VASVAKAIGLMLLYTDKYSCVHKRKRRNRHILADNVGVFAEFWPGIWEVYGSNL
jgi:hypothetical protein